MRSYAIGDVHGHLDKLRATHDLIAQDRAACGDADAPVIHLGDLVDRGPDSRGVIDFVMQGIAAGAPWYALRGNHDRMFGEFLNDPRVQDTRLREGLSWLHPRIGGAATLSSYGVANPGDRPIAPVHAEASTAVPPAHRAFLATLPPFHLRGEVLFVHAGIRPGIALENQDPDDLCWIREPFLSDTTDHGVLVVHGHTALDAATHYGNRVNIDTSAGYGGPVTAVAFEDRDVWVLGEDGRTPLLLG
jgi:serine/threonine protein phosphatase 1